MFKAEKLYLCDDKQLFSSVGRKLQFYLANSNEVITTAAEFTETKREQHTQPHKLRSKPSH